MAATCSCWVFCTIPVPFHKLHETEPDFGNFLPAYTSHELQPPDLNVFEAFKSYVQAALHRSARENSALIAFTVSLCIRNAYSKAFVRPKIQTGFVEWGSWSEEQYGTDVNVNAMSRLFKAGDENTVQNLVIAFHKAQRSVLRDADVEEEACVRINTANGANFDQSSCSTSPEKGLRNKRTRGE